MGGAQWKREFVQDHKFDFINVDDFVDNSCWRHFTYMLVFAAIIRGILVYCSDIFTAANLLANSNENSFVPKTGVQLDLLGKLPFDVYKYLFSGCILLGFVLLGLEIRRARMIIVSRDISYAFTSLIASRYYTVKSYPHFCLFAQINNSKKTVDEIAFFCFFTFRNWKRLMLADAPRQVINATILYQTFRDHPVNFKENGIFDWNKVVGADESLLLKKITLGGMIFTVFMFALSLLMLISAVILYIPLVSHIQGNLKEFCCHKIDKRIDELIRKKSKSRAADEAAKAGKDNGFLNLKQPTLPQVDLLEAPLAPSVNTPRTAYTQKTPAPHYAQTPKSAYSYPQQQQSQQQQQQQGYLPAGQFHNAPGQQQSAQRGYDYYQAKPTPSAKTAAPSKPKDAFDPYAASAFTGDDIYNFYAGEQDRPHLQQKYPGQGQTSGQGSSRDGYGYGGASYTQGGGAGTPKTYSGNNVGGSNNQTPPRTRRYDEYAQQRPASPIQSQHGSDLDNRRSSSRHSGSQVGAGNAVAANYGNARYPPRSNGSATYGQEYQTNPRRQQQQQQQDMPSNQRGAYRGAGY
ncbi:hypothetical protein BGZ54_010204 [Gamsiella multidivaricata]|nr:hypothetical protein BGZ54_010204 [Gamsiella multidivaricata]